MDRQFGGGYYYDTGRGGGGGGEDIELTTTITSEIKLTVDGRNISGSTETVIDFECEGRNCFENSSCKTTNEFVGVLVNADVEYVMGAAAGN